MTGWESVILGVNGKTALRTTGDSVAKLTHTPNLKQGDVATMDKALNSGLNPHVRFTNNAGSHQQ